MTSKQDVFEKIDFERKWLMAAGLSEHNIDVVFDSIKIAVDLMVKALEQKPKTETVTEFADRCRECGARYGKLLEQKSGKWTNNHNGTYECSRCGKLYSRSNYCPNCGAKMEVSE